MSVRPLRAWPTALALVLALFGAASAAAAVYVPPRPPAARWSGPASIASCPTSAAPLVTFPSSDPFTPSGPGAILYAADRRRCPTAGVVVLGIASDDRPTSAPASISPALGEVRQAIGSWDGQIVLVGRASSGAQALWTQGIATRSFASPLAIGAPGAPVALSRAYRGDIAFAGFVRDRARLGRWEVDLRFEGFNIDGYARRLIPALSGEPTALALALDYRGDIMLAWQQAGEVYTRLLHRGGKLEPIQSVGPSAPSPTLQALYSDSGHGIVAWLDAHAGRSGTQTRINLGISDEAAHFHGSQVVEAYRDLDRAPLGPGSLRLVRLSTESVMMAWTGVTHARYVIRAAAVHLGGVKPPSIVSDPRRDARLVDLATGPDGEAVAVWTSAPHRRGGPSSAQQSILAARGVLRGWQALFGRPETVAAAGGQSPAVAFDPSSDRAILVWVTDGPHPRLVYAVRPPGPRLPHVIRHQGPAPSTRVAIPAGRSSRAWIAGVAGGVLLALAGIAAVLVRRRRAALGR